MAHPLEELLRASAQDILDAVLRGFRAQVDVKGKLAELYLSRELERLRARGIIDHFDWNDKDGFPDFEAYKNDRKIIIECKNARSHERLQGGDWATVELQKTRGGKDGAGKPTRGYRLGHFHILGVCLFNVTKHWEFRFARCKNLAIRKDQPDVLVVMQNVPFDEVRGWTQDLARLIAEELSEPGSAIEPPCPP